MSSLHLDEMSGVTGYLNRMMSRTMDGVVIFDEVGRILFANAAFGRLVGRPPTRLVRHSLLGLMREDERAGVLRRWRGLVPGREETYRVHLRAPGGGERLMVVNQHALELSGGVHLAYVRDLAETAELSHQMHELQGLANIARAFASITDPRQMMAHLVHELARLMGVEKCYISLYDPASEMIEPQAPAYGIHDQDLPYLRTRRTESAYLAEIVHAGQPFISNEPATDPLLDQQIVHQFEVRSMLTVPLTSASATGQRILGFVTVLNRFGSGFHDDDVRPLQIFASQVAVALENARLLRELAHEKDVALARAGQLEALVNSMVDGVFIAAADGRVIQVNTAGLALTGLDSETALCLVEDYIPLLDMRGLSGRSLSADQLPLRRALRGEIVQNQEILLRPRARAHEAIINVSAAPVHAADGAIMLAVSVARDVTELRELQRHKDDFLSVASHELRTPLTLMRGHAQQVLRSLERDDELDRQRIAESLQSVIRQVDRLTNLTRDLADVSRMGSTGLTLVPAPCDLAALTNEVVGRFRISPTTQRHQLVLAVPDHAVVGEWDADRLEQVLTNLLDNAIKYSPKGGTVEVCLREAEGRAILSIRDEGIGIPPDKIDRLFQPFYRVESNPDTHAKGLGLGLHIVHEIVRLHGGSVEVESTPDQGSLFTVSLPLKQ